MPDTPPADAPRNEDVPTVTPTEAETDLGEKGEKALEAWKQRARAAEKRAKVADELEQRLKEIEDRDKSEAEKLAERAAAAEKVAADTQAAYLRMKVAVAKSLPPELAARLQGSTEEELTADADELLAAVGARRTNGSGEGGARQSAPVTDDGDMNQLIRQQLRR